MIFIVYILSISYGFFICWCILGWMRLRETNQTFTGALKFISVIIPARNEELEIRECLEDFLHQSYPTNLFEAIVVNDHSTDETASVVRKFIEEHQEIKVKLIEPDSFEVNKLYKKQAITSGVEEAQGTLIITTDADCRRGAEWLSTIAGFYESNNSELISAPVFLEGGESWIEKMQALEFLGLVGIGAACIRNGMPVLCNGANLAFPKKIFFEVNGYHAKNNVASGDDTQLLMKVAKRGTDKIHFIKSKAAAVTTMPQKTTRQLLQQRQRWASKIPFHMSAFTILIGGIAFFLHVGLLISAVMIFVTGNSTDFIFPLLIKMIPEFLFLLLICRFADKTKLLYLFLPAQLIYPIYISFVGLTSLFGKHQWKGRTQ